MARNVKINFRLSKPNPLQIMADHLNDVAGLEVFGVREGHKKGIDVDNRKFKPKKDGSPSRLVDTHTMEKGWHISQRATVSKVEAVITSGARSSKYARFAGLDGERVIIDTKKLLKRIAPAVARAEARMVKRLEDVRI